MTYVDTHAIDCELHQRAEIAKVCCPSEGRQRA
jgi:hypothetical protein